MCQIVLNISVKICNHAACQVRCTAVATVSLSPIPHAHILSAAVHRKYSKLVSRGIRSILRNHKRVPWNIYTSLWNDHAKA